MAINPLVPSILDKISYRLAFFYLALVFQIDFFFVFLAISMSFTIDKLRVTMNCMPKHSKTSSYSRCKFEMS